MLKIKINKSHLSKATIASQGGLNSLFHCLLAEAVIAAHPDAFEKKGSGIGFLFATIGETDYSVDEKTASLVQLFCDRRYSEVAKKLPHTATLTEV